MLNFHPALFQSSVSHDLSEIILIYDDLLLKKLFFIITNDENDRAA